MNNLRFRRVALRTSLAIAALSAALSAHAWIITVLGTYDPNTNLATSTVFEFSSLPQLNNTFTWGLFVTGTGALAPGTTSFANGPSSITMDSIAGTEASDTTGSTFSFSGGWTATSIVNLPVNPTGTYSGSFDGEGFFTFSFVGTTVPEPASLAMIGIGLVGLARARRRK